jgi:hypothetical protein
VIGSPCSQWPTRACVRPCACVCFSVMVMGCFVALRIDFDSTAHQCWMNCHCEDELALCATPMHPLKLRECPYPVPLPHPSPPFFSLPHLPVLSPVTSRSFDLVFSPACVHSCMSRVPGALSLHGRAEHSLWRCEHAAMHPSPIPLASSRPFISSVASRNYKRHASYPRHIPSQWLSLSESCQHTGRKGRCSTRCENPSTETAAKAGVTTFRRAGQR